MLHLLKLKAEGRKKLAILIVNHLVSDVKTDGFDKESTESLDIAIQCLKSTYNLNPTEIENVDVKLEDVIKKYYPDVETMLNIKCDVAEEKAAEYHNDLGYEFLKNQNHEKAIEFYSIAIALNPTNAMFYSDRASAYNSNGKYNEAIDDCQKAIQLDPTCSSAYDRLGSAYSILKDFHKAFSCFEKACELNPGQVAYWHNYQSALTCLQAMSPTQQSQLHVKSAVVPTLMNDSESFSGLNYVLTKINTNDELIKFLQFLELIFTHLQIIDPDLLDGLLQMHSQRVQNAGQTPPDNDVPVDDNQSINTNTEI